MGNIRVIVAVYGRREYGLLIRAGFWFNDKSLWDWPLLMCCLSLPASPLVQLQSKYCHSTTLLLNLFQMIYWSRPRLLLRQLLRRLMPTKKSPPEEPNLFHMWALVKSSIFNPV